MSKNEKYHYSDFSFIRIKERSIYIFLSHLFQTVLSVGIKIGTVFLRYVESLFCKYLYSLL